ncbi:transketolase-like TK C-terminal-containing protein, partial [Marichromatium gracile]|uniref:transketolase-like TK C-terminal-containing protein n=1 Tax=Marichromatium gracile TaxID=1048 RepID=UPI003B8A6558|nr:pyruvate dehydrogenase (acetyl-transferring), homodimeric type [Marichromatium gracile]
AQAAAQLLADDWQVASEVYSVTSFSELARQAREVERWNRLHPQAIQRVIHVNDCLPKGAPVVAVSDYVRAVPQMIASYLDSPYTVLGTDGFGRSDTRAALRDFFEVDRHHLVLAALTALAEQGSLDRQVCQQAIERYGLQAERAASWT